jgi:aspartyl/asparaginyl beta-hydroxylase (cupin superfamily)
MIMSTAPTVMTAAPALISAPTIMSRRMTITIAVIRNTWTIRRVYSTALGKQKKHQKNYFFHDQPHTLNVDKKS